MFRHVRFLMVVVPVLMATAAPAAKIVVLTEEPVAVFVLPDGSVLKNAYVWRRTSEGLMIIHDAGQYFLNYQTLPPEWKAVYLTDDTTTDPVDESKPEARAEEAPGADRYKIGSVLEKVPALAEETREKLLARGGGKELDQGALVIALLQTVLDEDRENASRCILFLEERGHKIGEVERDKLFESCPFCAGDGSITRNCRACDASGACSKCKKSATTLGKRSGRDKQTMTELGNRSGQDTDCKMCEGTGECASCKGDGEVEIRCSKCRGAGKIVARIYCEVVRDKWIRQMNALVSGNPPASIMASPSMDIGSVLGELPGINTNALAFYTSPNSDGGMDTNILVACLMHTLVEKNLPVAKRFKVMLEVEYPKNGVIDIDAYLKFCRTCRSKGWCDHDCPRCGGSGDCEKCEGGGDSMKLKNWEVSCSACKGTGKCSACDGSGEIAGTCRTCKGLGRTFEQSRCEIRRELMVDELNEYYWKNRTDSM